MIVNHLSRLQHLFHLSDSAIGKYSNPRVVFHFQASAFVVTYPINNAVDEVGNENGKAVAWEKAFVQLVKV